ncbi:hypothetical protein COO91_09947 (plasmid) [Nostoc flagelliforme CCNUN1]|uniref:Uncharacterized protein n=1 Tax=Nostoc flagelliforme CCNUN1 TaxID=2038116 RepID=A0A2K8T7T9_9NOSO|nr:hypothetical protein COO91_09947 [Nostoc flagelliforme CCNUN1]
MAAIATQETIKFSFSPLYSRGEKSSLQQGTRIFHSFAVECLFRANYLYLTSPKFTQTNFKPMPSREQPMNTSNDIDTNGTKKSANVLFTRVSPLWKNVG